MPHLQKKPNMEPVINAIQLLRQQHRELEALLAELETTTPKLIKKREDLVRQLVISLEAHTWIEEKILYPAGLEVDPAMTFEAFEEHSLIQFMLHKIVDTEAEDEAFLPRVKVLKEIVEHHVREEEEEYFARLQNKLSPRRLADIGIEMHDEFASRTKRLRVVV
ncbi:MAG TPA: hemerythrin domain-containing protein [Oligoflexus sp.]|uniref:hemerythrin domain-containing protein n=1 Tax=Oligoflexus sp. TaxID=1971216 RepID=UPI002D7FC852|nr:hemerythrin domain-containing protein [Oligoflexus sp.]HET9241606.1 hemerythrin domain-containing protein [Oligoflexus sp.]